MIYLNDPVISLFQSKKLLTKTVMNRIIRILFIIVSITGMLLLNGVYMKIQAQAITTQPVDVDFCTGSTKDASFTVGGASILTYQWQRYVFDIVKPYWEDIRNETDSKLVIPAPTGGWSSKYEIASKF